MAKIAAVSSGSPEFDRLRDYLNRDLSARNEVRDALFALTEHINVSDRGSRFVAGGTVEWIIAAACYAADIVALPAGHNANGYDLTSVQSAVKGMFSVKASLSPTSAFRITNGINGAGKGFVEPTIFLHKRLKGLVFADPTLHTELRGRAEAKADAVVLSLKAIMEHAEKHPECVIEVEVPYNQGRGTYDAAQSFAEKLLTDGSGYPILRRVFEEVRRSGNNLSEEIASLRALLDNGTLTEQQFGRAIDKLIGR